MSERMVLPDAMRLALEAERDAEAAWLREMASELAGMSAAEYLGRGITVWGVRNFDIAGRLAKASMTGVEYVADKPSWMVRYQSGVEAYVGADVVARVFDGTTEKDDLP